ncbi:MAG: sulfotransferase [Candidatus Marinimicrobia bacterium]|nr:sulfotransferase [Candidatus Neomarinimicrobiota bacterium]
MNQAGPVFVRGMSRSGGTLLCTILDSHSLISMSYEIYPHYLENPELHKRLRKYMSERAGIPYLKARKMIRQAGVSIQEQLDFVENVCRYKMENEHKQIWGCKILRNYDACLERWPDVRILDIVRDGRDVMASQFGTKKFSTDQTPAKIAEVWVNTHQTMLDYQEKAPANFYLLSYEQLIRDPSTVLQKACDFMGLDYEPEMAAHHEQSHLISKSHHISRDRVIKPLDDSKIGRWHQDLSPDQISEFMEVAGPLMKDFSYTAD